MENLSLFNSYVSDYAHVERASFFRSKSGGCACFLGKSRFMNSGILMSVGCAYNIQVWCRTVSDGEIVEVWWGDFQP